MSSFNSNTNQYMIGTRRVVMLFIFFFNSSMHQLRLNWSNIIFELSPLIHTNICTYIRSYVHIFVDSYTTLFTH